MSKREYILRYLTIIKKLRNKRLATFDEISDHLFDQEEITGYKLDISLRTFQRDLNDIRTLFNIDIKFDRIKGVYYISEDEESDLNNRMLEAFDLFNTINMADNLVQHVQFEKRRPQGTEHFYGLLHAIKNHLVIHFTHQKFWEDAPTNRTAEPYSLKESQNRWYLIAKDLKDNRIKTFGLDRILDIEITRKNFEIPLDLNLKEMFRYSFGVISSEGHPEEIVLSFDSEQGKYIKSYPLHETQHILIDTDEEFRIRLKLHITHDLIMNLMSYGDTLKVIEPKRLVNVICENYHLALKNY
jgi:predicted DNA-binding transcriptional regulator YafY